MTMADTHTIRVHKIQTPKGERVKIRSDRLDASVTLDALALESVTWQTDAATLTDLLRAPPTPTPADGVTIDVDTGDDGELKISNEYTHVVLRPGADDAGSYLDVESIGLDYEIRLDAAALEVLAWQEDAYAMSKFLETPFGPEDVTSATKLVDAPDPDAGE